MCETNIFEAMATGDRSKVWKIEQDPTDKIGGPGECFLGMRRPLSNKDDPWCLISASVGFRSDKTCAAEQEDESCAAILRLGSNKMPGIGFA
ncbi:hypothetical protein GCM10007858_31030 [Bradyrhizobium liaoningense]|nr:hypothetical protein GCM10007858_31030 [Bradyrhizobium liaoningense]